MKKQGVKIPQHHDDPRALALARLRRELDRHERSGAPETPFVAAIREQLAAEDAVDDRSSGSSAA